MLRYLRYFHKAEEKKLVTTKLKGGLGNQLFQYAVGYAIAERLSQILELDTSFYASQTQRGYKLDKLSISDVNTSELLPKRKDIRLYTNRYFHRILVAQKGKRIIKCDKELEYLFEHSSTHELTKEVFSINAPNIYVDGYFQSARYFENVEEKIRQQFVPSYAPEEEYLRKLNEIKQVNAVAVHVRRGDFLKAEGKNSIAYVLGEQYYHHALKYMSENVDNPVFFWFSDDIAWVKDNFAHAENYRFISLKTKYADIDEMMLMKNCRHIIAANSTFSWWAAWLNEHTDCIRTVPDKQYGNIEMIPKKWIKISVE